MTSPLSRTRVTAELIAGAFAERLGRGGEVELDEALVELDYGSLEGRRMADIDPGQLTSWRHDPSWRPAGGETLTELHRRVGRWCEAMTETASGADVIAVSHVSPIKAAAAWAIGGGPELAWKMTLRIASISRISTSPRSLVSFGETGHLGVGGP